MAEPFHIDVLIIEDDREIGDILEAYMVREGMKVARAYDGEQGLSLTAQLHPRLIVLDIGLPRRDGIDVLKTLRQASSVPIIMCTARGEDIEKITALKLGADDYIAKPFNPFEVVARIEAVLRRSTPKPGPTAVRRIGPLELDGAAREIRVSRVGHVSCRLILTPAEHAILERLCLAPGRAFSRAELLESAAPESDPFDRIVDSHVSRVRFKLAEVGAPGLIETVRGYGYRLSVTR